MFGLPLLASMHALTFALQSAARADEPSAIESAIATILADFHISNLYNVLTFGTLKASAYGFRPDAQGYAGAGESRQ